MQLLRALPISRWLPGYDRNWFKSDLAAGLTVWALVVPQALAYAQIAGLPPHAGVFASFAAPLGYALFGTSRQLICSPTSATAAISAALVAPAVAGDPDSFAAMSAALAILCGVAYVLLGRLQLGFISQFIASAVQTGFLFGLGMTIIIGQLFKVFGFDGTGGPFYKQFWYFLTHLNETNRWTLALGASAFAAVVLLGTLMPKLPAAFLLVAMSIVIVSVFDLDQKGVAVVGDVERAFPTPALPRVDPGAFLTLVPGALAIVAVGYSESISVARRFADQHQYQIRPNQELTALGVSSALGGLFQGFITGGGASQSAANDRAGARTQVSSLILAMLAVLTSIVLMPFFRNLPLAVLAVIVINAVLGFMSISAMKQIHDLRKDSFALAIIALMGVLFLGILPGLLVAVVLSLILLLSWVSRPTVSSVAPSPSSGTALALNRHPELSLPPGIGVFRIDAPLLFANANWVRDAVMAAVKEMEAPQVAVLDLEASPELDITGLEALRSLQRDLDTVGVDLWLSNVHAPARDMLRRGDLVSLLSQERIFATAADAVASYESQVPSSVQGDLQ